ncbi:tetratricopeptide repeat protein [Tepidamorphus sp. 3E244]|uniref:tetratricopeptide repeat protein n=1 Tax=Tepidamorphus sp. 3E244 TaxID=3385498 RepID=UPI0038FC0DCF
MKNTVAVGLLACMVTQPVLAEIRVTEKAAPTQSFVGNYLAGRFAVQQRDKEAAALFLGAALDQSPEDMSLLDQAFVAALGAGEFEVAVDRARDLLKADAGNRLARIAVAADALRARKYAQVGKLMDGQFENPLAKITGTFIQAWAEIGAGRNAEGIRIAAEMDDLNNGDIRRIKDYTIGMLAEAAGDNKQALAAYERAYDSPAINVRVVEALARVHCKNGDFGKAREYADAFEERAPGHSIIRRTYKAIAGKRPTPFTAKTPQAGAAETIYSIGAALGRDPGDEMAVMFYQMALLLDPKAPLPLIGLAGYYDAVDQYQSAISVLDRMPVDSPYYVNSQVSKARVLDEVGQTKDSLEILDSLAIASPTREVFVARASVLHDKKRYADAARAYSRAIATLDKVRNVDWYLFYYRGMVRERAKQWPLAEGDFKKALELNPEQPHVLNYLGYTWIDQGKNLDEALKLVKRAVELRPKDGDIVDSLGWAYYRLARYEESVKTLERAIELRPEEPIIHDHLGDAYWQVGRRFEAYFQWQHAIDLKPEDADLLDNLREKLNNGLQEDNEQQAAAQVTE